MKNNLKRSLAVLLAVFMLFPAAGAIVSAEEGAVYKAGDVIEYGAYPQTDVTESLGSELDALNGTWVSYNYCSGKGVWDDGQIRSSDYMRYKDVVYKGEKYRGVTFDSYRPNNTGLTTSAEHSSQDENGYYAGKVYWFKYEPIKWRIIDPETGFIMCDSIIDSQAYNNYIVSYGTDEKSFVAYWGDPDNTYFASNYEKSSIRQWLNGDFYNTAFTDVQKANIKITALENKSAFLPYYDVPLTYDKIFLLSWDEAMCVAYGYNPSESNFYTAIKLSGSDYAKCQGLWVNRYEGNEYQGNSYWRLRSPGHSPSASGVSYDGYACNDYNVNDTDYGICPALKLQNLNIDEASEFYSAVVMINNYVYSKTIDYKTTITFKADVKDPVSGAAVHWFIDGKDKGTGDTCTMKKATESFTVQAKYIKDGKVLSESGVESVNVKTGFFAKLAAFFKSIFGALPKVVQGYVGVDVIEKFIPR